jgi:alkylation response protein AidB-like acyl-CoA dehydrogenase
VDAPFASRGSRSLRLPLYEGTSQVQRLVIARETLLPRADADRATVAA